MYHNLKPNSYIPQRLDVWQIFSASKRRFMPNPQNPRDRVVVAKAVTRRW